MHYLTSSSIHSGDLACVTVTRTEIIWFEF